MSYIIFHDQNSIVCGAERYVLGFFFFFANVDEDRTVMVCDSYQNIIMCMIIWNEN